MIELKSIMILNMKRKFELHASSSLDSHESKPILFCAHASWHEHYGKTVIPGGTQLWIYAPLGAALSQEVARAIAANETIKPGDLQIRSISPLTLFNLGYDVNKASKVSYEPKILSDYPLCLHGGETIANYCMFSPGKDALYNKDGNIEVLNIALSDGIFLSELLKQNKGRTCHYGGCSWVVSKFEKRDIVTFANPDLAKKYKDPELTEEEKRELRRKRFAL